MMTGGKILKGMRENPWIVSTLVLGIAVLILIIMVLGKGSMTGNVIAGEEAGKSIVDYLNSRVGGGVGYVSYEDLGNIYEVTVSYQGENVPVYVSKDGKYFIQGVLPISSIQKQPTPAQQQQEPTEIPKSDKPRVELFVMTYCPYGLQAEKGIIPVLELLKDKIDGKIRFVHYFMHGDEEEQETYNQVCIREEQSSKYLDYLKCFADKGDSQECIKKAGIDETKLNNCLKNKAKDYYAEDSELSQKYGVRGSPTLIINGVEARSGRSSAAYLSTICSAFNTSPDECNQTVNSQTPNPGFGYSYSSSGSSSGSC